MVIFIKKILHVQVKTMSSHSFFVGYARSRDYVLPSSRLKTTNYKTSVKNLAGYRPKSQDYQGILLGIWAELVYRHLYRGTFRYGTHRMDRTGPVLHLRYCTDTVPKISSIRYGPPYIQIRVKSQESRVTWQLLVCCIVPCASRLAPLPPASLGHAKC